MGRTFAQDLAVSVPLEQGVAIHLSSNFYPPIPNSMVKPCMEAIGAYLDGDPYRQIDLPKPVTYKGDYTAPAEAIIEQHRLEEFINAITDGEVVGDDE